MVLFRSTSPKMDLWEAHSIAPLSSFRFLNSRNTVTTCQLLHVFFDCAFILTTCCRDIVVIAQWLAPIMMHMLQVFCVVCDLSQYVSELLQRLSTAARLLEGTDSKIIISSSVQSLLTLLESSDFALGKGISIMFAKAVKSTVHAPSSEIYRIGDPCNQVHIVVAGKVAKMVTEGNRNTRVHVSASAEECVVFAYIFRNKKYNILLRYGLADVVEADACLSIDALYDGDTLHSRSAVAVTACVIATLSRR